MTGSELGDSHTSLTTASGRVGLHRLQWLGEQGLGEPDRLPVTVKILLEGVLRHASAGRADPRVVKALTRWPHGEPVEVPFRPARVLMQDFTGVPAVVDLAALRAAVARAGGEPSAVEPRIPVDLVVDHSVQVDVFGSGRAYAENLSLEYTRNGERYALLRWAQSAFRRFRVVPPGAGICHQVNLEHLSRVVRVEDGEAFPDTLVGTDSHTTMVNGLGVLGWGVGGIEAEAAMLGQPIAVPWPSVVGVRLSGRPPIGSTATDVVLTLTEMLRRHGVVGRFVEFTGAGLAELEVPDRATLSNMAPEYGATAALFPVDVRTLAYLAQTGRGDLVDVVERYTKEQGMFFEPGASEPVFSEVLDLDLGTVEPSMAGPKRPQDRVPLRDVPRSFADAFPDAAKAPAPANDREVSNGSVVIAAITSCTNTSNPSVMVAAGLLAKRAVEAGLSTQPWVKTSLAPGSRVVVDYLDRAGLTPYLDKLGFQLVGFGCTTCIGNSGPLSNSVEQAITTGDLAVVAVLSGNRNFEGRIHPLVRASYLASPPLCVAYALAGRIDIDLTREPLGAGADAGPVFLADLWPSAAEVQATIGGSLSEEQFEEEYRRVFDGDDRWRALPAPTGELFEWDPASTYVREPAFFEAAHGEPLPVEDIVGARALLVLGGSVTTDHISPAGAIKAESDAGIYLQQHGVDPRAFNSYGSRRGNHEVMVRGTFGNIRLRNELVPGSEGPVTVHLPDGDRMTVYEAALRYRDEHVPLIVLAGKEYGSGSSRDWAAKGTALLGIRAVLAESFERIHRSNLVGMGVLPLQFRPGETRERLGLTGREVFSIRGLSPIPGPEAAVEVEREDESRAAFEVIVRLDGPAEAEQYRQGGVLPMVARSFRTPGGSGTAAP
jgi:aconitate hydratase